MSANLLVANADKTQFMTIGGQYNADLIMVGSTPIKKDEEIKKLLSMKINGYICKEEL
jgi:hypothetical protein